MAKSIAPPSAAPLTGQNILDKALAYAFPSIAVKRMQSRNQLALSGGYAGAKVDRAQLSYWRPGAGSPRTDIIRDLPELRSRSRDQMRNSPVALGALNTDVSHTIGTGLAASPSIDGVLLGLTEGEVDEWQNNTRRRFEAWANSPDCDVARQLDFYGLQELSYRSHRESGDAVVLTPVISRAGKARQLALQLIEADRICNPDRGANTDTLVDGIEIAAETCEVVACHVSRRHPGDSAAANVWDRVAVRGGTTGRRNVLFLFKPVRPGQVRGVPWIAPILEPLKQLGRWSDAELNAAVISGLNATFVTMDPDAFDDLYDDDAQELIIQNASKWTGAMESGQAVNLLPGENITSPTPGRPNPAFDPFWVAMVRQIGMALEMPYEVLVMHFQSSYSAARAALLMAWKAFRSRRDLWVKLLCQPVYELWLENEVANDRIGAPGFFADPVIRAAWCGVIWTGDGPGSIDPQKEVDAAQKRVDMGISTKDAESVLHDGVPWATKFKQRVKEINSEKEAGVYFPPAGTAPQPAGPVAPVPPDGEAIPPAQ